jgi:gas vesicle protein
METTVSGLFPDSRAASRAREELENGGFAPETIMVLTRDTEGLHELLGEETSDAARGAVVGGVVGAVGLAIAVVAMSSPPLLLFELHWVLAALAGVVVGGIAGALIGLLIGSATGHQVQEEYEAMIENGGQLLAVNTDARHAVAAFEALRRSGGAALSTSVHRKHHVRDSA